MPSTVILLKNLVIPSSTVSSNFCGIREMNTSPISFGKLWKFSFLKRAASSKSTNLADTSKTDPPQVWHILGMIKISLRWFSSIYFLKRSFSLNFISHFSFHAAYCFFCIISRIVTGFCDNITKDLLGYITKDCACFCPYIELQYFYDTKEGDGWFWSPESVG